MYTRVFQKVLCFTQNRLEKQDIFSLFFNIVPIEVYIYICQQEAYSMKNQIDMKN